MKLTELKQKIVNNKLDNLYIFTGEEYKVMEIYIDKIASSYTKQMALSVNDILSELRLGSSLYSKHKCYVIRDDYECVDNLDKLKQLIGKNIIILIYTNIDKRNKLYKQNKDNICEFNVLEDNLLTDYLSRKITLKEEQYKRLIEICNHNYGRALLEIDKINSYGDNSEEIFDLFIKNNIISIPPKDAVFELVDAILMRNGKLAYKLLEECKKIGEANLVILTNLFNSTRQLLQVQSYNGTDIVKGTGLTMWQIRNTQKKCNYWSNRELINIMKTTQRIEVGIKTGIYEDDSSIDYLLEEVFIWN